MIKNTSNSYGVISKAFHWGMALLIIGLLIMGFIMDELKIKNLYYIHKTLGFFILILALLRIIWRFRNIIPNYNNMPKIMAFGANAMHYTLFVLMISMAFSGFIASNLAGRPVSFLFMFDLPLIFEQQNIELAKKLMELHSIIAIALVVTISIHIVAAFAHHFVFKDNILKRMLPCSIK